MIEKDTAFKQYAFTDDELFQVYVFSDMQLAGIKNEIGVASAMRAQLPVDPDRTVEIYIREQEYLRGKIEGLEFLLAMHERVLSIRARTLEEELMEKQLADALKTNETNNDHNLNQANTETTTEKQGE